MLKELSGERTGRHTDKQTNRQNLNERIVGPFGKPVSIELPGGFAVWQEAMIARACTGSFRSSDATLVVFLPFNCSSDNLSFDVQ